MVRLLVALLVVCGGASAAAAPLTPAEAAGLVAALVDRVQPALPGSGWAGAVPGGLGCPPAGASVEAWWNAALDRVGGWFAVNHVAGAGALTAERARLEVAALVARIGAAGKAVPLVLLGHGAGGRGLVFVGLAYIGPPEPRLVALRVDAELRTAFDRQGPLGVRFELASRTGLPLRDYLAASERSARLALGLLDDLHGLPLHPLGLPAVIPAAELPAYLSFEHSRTRGLEAVSYRFAARPGVAFFATLPLLHQHLQSNITLTRAVAIARAVEETRDGALAPDLVPAP